MSDDVEVRHGTVTVGGCDECGGVECSPDEARALAAQILDAATKAEANIAAIAAACADGHDWSDYLNSWHFWPDTKVAIRYCERDGCDGRIEEPGWVEFAGRLHYQPISPRTARRVDCYGPGCEHCDSERFGKELHAVLEQAYEAAAAHLDATVFGKEGE